MVKVIDIHDKDLSDRCKLLRQSMREYLDRTHYLIPGESGLTEKERGAIADMALHFAFQYFTTDNKG
jgi:hypothetical protein